VPPVPIVKKFISCADAFPLKPSASTALKAAVLNNFIIFSPFLVYASKKIQMVLKSIKLIISLNITNSIN
jgi:hypothetical protein